MNYKEKLLLKQKSKRDKKLKKKNSVKLKNVKP